MRNSIILTILLLGSTIASRAQDLPLDPSVRTGKLPNGFTYFIRHNEEPKNRATMFLVNKAGAILEDEDQRGLAHFMEHMSFNGTKHFPHNQLVDYLQKAGVRFGADINAYTSFDETVYQLPIPSDQPELLQGGIQILRDWAHEALLDPTEIDKERGVVLEEERLGKGAGERMERAYYPVLLNQSRYAYRLPIGQDTVLKNFTRPVIARFYNDWYRPDLQALIVVGDVDVNQIELMIKQRFSDLKNPVHERPRVNYAIPLEGKNQFIAVTDKEMTATEAELLIKHRAPELRTAADYRQRIIVSLFNQMLAGRYAEIARKADPPYISGNARITELINGIDDFSATVNAKPGELEKGFKAVWREVIRIKRFGFTQSELERAKAAYLNGMNSAVKEKNKINSESYAAEYQAYFLKGEASPGIDIEFSLIKKDLPGITLTDFKKLVAEYITSVNRDILITAPEKEKDRLPDEAQILSWLKSVETEDIKPYQDKVLTKPLLVSKPVAGSIINEQFDKRFGITTLKLSNGMKILLKPTDFKNDQIIFGGFAPGGTSLYNDSVYESASSASGLVTAGGIGNYNMDELRRFLTGKQLSVSPYINERSEGINGSTNNEDLETAMQLIYAYFTEPRKDTAVFNGIMMRSKARLANRFSDPGSVFNDTISTLMSNNNPRRTGPSIQKLNQINLDKAYQVYQERFADAANFTFTFVGSVDPKTIKPLLEKYLASLPATNSHETAKDLNIHPPAGRISKTVYQGNDSKATVYLVFTAPYNYNHPDNIAMKALQEVLEIRLLERLREEESGVYTPGVEVNVSKLPQTRYSVLVRFGCAPENVEKMINSSLEEIKKLKTEGPPQVNIDKWRSEEKNSFTPQLKTNDFWLGYLNGQLQSDEDFGFVQQYETLLNGVGPQDIKRLADKYLDGKNYIRMVLLPEATAAK
ncbi:M16 family metallopeptidase [Mucilaginibacter kameinonensis]|uniref:M16 family metallopeptidase n=1 Tax=Mucilaginibacter kameinonensis TaxID=452286 RepID=UPI000EF78921|nr:M16 family metallopeptidase [Mucilaginibacter kameinonensis]